jgi:quinol monooxygenase YgiN
MSADSVDATVYEHVTLMRARTAERERVLSLLGRLIEFYSGQPGYIEAYTLVSPEDASGSSISGITVWQDRDAVDRATALDQARLLRAELDKYLVEGSNVERGFSAQHEPLVARSR